MDNRNVFSLEAVLGSEAQALTSGDLDALPRIAQDKVAAFRAFAEALQQRRLSPDDLTRIRDLATRNAKLLVAARAGIERVQSIRDRAQSAREGFSTYGADGSKTKV